MRRKMRTVPFEEVSDRLHSAAIHLLRAARRDDESFGLSGARLSALSVVVFAGPLALGPLAAAEQVRPPTMTRLVQGLERSGLVTRVKDRADRRVSLVRSTRRGETLLRRARARRVEAIGEIVGSSAPEDLAILDAASRILERCLAGRSPREGREPTGAGTRHRH